MKKNLTKGHAWLLKQGTKTKHLLREHIFPSTFIQYTNYIQYTVTVLTVSWVNSTVLRLQVGNPLLGQAAQLCQHFQLAGRAISALQTGQSPNEICNVLQIAFLQLKMKHLHQETHLIILFWNMKHEDRSRKMCLRKQVVVISQQQSDLQQLLWRERLCPGARMPQTSLAALHQRLLWVQQHPRLPQCKPSMVIGAFDCFRNGTNVQIPFNMFIRARQQHFDARSFCF